MPIQAKPVVLLWDIDGTLVCTGKAGENALVLALARSFGIATSLQDVDYRGRTDLRILQMLLEKHALPATPENLSSAREHYLEALEEQLPQCPGKIHAGIAEILAVGPGQGVFHGLLTGNLRRGAQLKLGHFKIWHHFPFGAFADDHWDRNRISPFARDRAHQHVGHGLAPELYVIGDTPHDIACGRVIGARTIAVATGGYSLKELAAHQPDHLFEDFQMSRRFFDTVLQA